MEAIGFTELIKNILETSMQERFIGNYGKIYDYWLSNQKSVNTEFIESFKEVFTKATELQNEEKKGPIAYIVISFLRTRIIEEDYQLRIDLYDEMFYLDKVECSGYWKVDFVFQYLHEDIELFKEKIEEYIEKIQDNSYELIKKDYAAIYNYFLYEYLKKNIKLLLETEEYQSLNKTEDLKIGFGEYMDKVDIIYDQENP
ncbi:hypothetical protein SAMN05446037_100516 [Anaerovirgula multivorans]|uniref:Uncharacterized protein n=1 Tax=Anaerovirgula multivorans TaxID=312168 RepID=A0A239C7J5_9FIRM|nr:hypothetical protein [Anaerovirgula multivorans]SNS15353.1 hypothetical protein SAMN05446037_100516 [Anaerovirgula multivorans]